MQDDRVIEVLRCHSDKVVLLTSGHVALLACTSKPQDKIVTYKSKWTLMLHDVQNIRGTHFVLQPSIGCEIHQSLQRMRQAASV